ncbi:MAG: quercetin 2,3-dioxygenase [Phormidesmis priestleyi]|uniref:Quercetin 2,3-dioxygenase n=1 Tax=Phormidesmis priestleyi TaxID=268141 RepID=A0A2W4XYL9_9CYAN|nr:MAG: quercetin 2,3-dioxygenase [Phormidesmis priestleyi]
MITIRKAEERGASQLNWLNSQHSFSFGSYRDPRHMGFSDLRVINDDRVIAGAGFGTHGHRDMEIISYVLEGELAHRDSMDTGSVIRPGDVQRMSAGTGVTHSEMNASETDPVHFLQIWIIPDTQGLAPDYEQKHFALSDRQDQWRLVGSRDGQAGSVTIHQDVSLYTATLSADTKLTYELSADRKAWLQVARGEVVLNGEPLSAGDGAAIASLSSLELSAVSDKAEVLLFDLAN